LDGHSCYLAFKADNFDPRIILRGRFLYIFFFAARYYTLKVANIQFQLEMGRYFILTLSP
jgi:hypothetical protein